MRGSLLLALAATLVFAAPAGSGARPDDGPDGRLVLGVARMDPEIGAYRWGWAALANPRTGAVVRKRIPVGDLCAGPVVSADGRIGRPDWRAQRRLLRSAPALVRKRVGIRRLVAWSPSHRWLYFVSGDRRLEAWRAGTRTIVSLPVRPRGEVMSVVAVG